MLSVIFTKWKLIMSKVTNDPPLTQEQLKLVSNLSEAELSYIDSTLLSNVSSQWRKVARVIGTTMSEQDNKIKGVPDIFYSQRLSRLVTKGILQSQGNLQAMRYSEVRLPK